MREHTFYTPEEIDAIQAQHEKRATERYEAEKDMFIQEFRHYRCNACLNLCSSYDYFHIACEQKLKDGHSVKCVHDSLWIPDHICSCPVINK